MKEPMEVIKDIMKVSPDYPRRKAFLKAIGYTDEQAKDILSRENMGEYLDMVAECVMKAKFYGGEKPTAPVAPAKVTGAKPAKSSNCGGKCHYENGQMILG